MANVDIGLGKASAQPQRVHVGPNQVVCRISLSASTSAGDVLRIGKLPNGAIPTDCVFYGGAALPATLMSFGWSGSAAALIAQVSQSAAVVARGNVPLTATISLSDDARVLFQYITATPDVVMSVGYMGSLVVSYVMPGQNP